MNISAQLTTPGAGSNSTASGFPTIDQKRPSVSAIDSSIRSARDFQKSSPEPHRILIVDDEPNVRLSYRAALETEGLDVYEANSATKALDTFASQNFDLANLDMRMPEMDGLDLLAEMRKRGNNTPSVIITAYGDVPHAVRAMRLGAIDFLQKPLTPEQLRNLVAEIIARHVSSSESQRKESLRDDYASQLSEAKRLLNLRSFEPSWKHLARAMELNPQSPETLNLAGVYFEMQEDYDRARNLYGKAIKYGPYYEPAQQNMRRIFELFHFGSSKEPFAFGED